MLRQHALMRCRANSNLMKVHSALLAAGKDAIKLMIIQPPGKLAATVKGAQDEPSMGHTEFSALMIVTYGAFTCEALRIKMEVNDSRSMEA